MTGSEIESGAKFSVELILNVLRQHENDFDRSIAELELITHRLEQLAVKVQQLLEQLDGFSKIRNVRTS